MPDNKLVLLMAPTGDDHNDGLSLDTPILSLARAEALISEHCKNTPRDVEVRIGPGIYENQKVRWHFTMPTHSITFMPLFNDKVRPIFKGTDGTWFTLDVSNGEKTNLNFRYIHVENYQTAISLNGSRNALATFNSHNTIYGCYFKAIGNGFNPSLEPSTACVRLVNSRYNTIRNNHFVGVINDRDQSLLHAIYIAHYAHWNKIEANRFEDVCGDPVRVRDYSNYNSVTENRFDNTGIKGAYTEWYCNSDEKCNGVRAGCDCTKFRDIGVTECPSWGNEFRNNKIGKKFNGVLQLSHWNLDGPETHSGCQRPSDPNIKRLRTSGNE